MRKFLHKFFSKKAVKVTTIVLLSLAVLFAALVGLVNMLSNHGEYLSIYLAGGSWSKLVGETSVKESEFAYCDELKTMTLSNTVTDINKNAFMGCSNLKNVNFVNNSTLTTIGESAFYYTKNLKKISLPDSLRIIEKYAFSYSGLTSMTVPEGVTTIGDEAFRGCTDLVSVSIPASVTNIGTALFKECKKLETIEVHPDNPAYCAVDNVLYSKDMTQLIAWPCTKTIEDIPESVTTIANSAFAFNATTDIVELSENISTIGASAFEASSLTEIHFPENTLIKTIEEKTFLDCKFLNNVTIPASVEEIGDMAFRACESIDSLTIPRTVKRIGYTAFATTSITYVYIPNTLEEVDSSVFANCYKLTKAEIEDGVTTIDEGMFYSCEALTEIIIPDSVTTIEDAAFCHCSNLRNITIPATVETIGEYTFSHCERLFYIDLPEDLPRIENSTFAHCYMLKEIDIPESVTYIGERAFENCRDLRELNFPSELEHIGAFALNGCNRITHLTVPATVRRIDKMAFSQMDTLSTLVFLKDENQAPNTILGEELLDQSYNLQSLTLAPHIQKIEKEAFYHNSASKVYFSGTSDEWLAVRLESGAIPKNWLIIFTDTVCDIHGGYESVSCHMCY